MKEYYAYVSAAIRVKFTDEDETNNLEDLAIRAAEGALSSDASLEDARAMQIHRADGDFDGVQVDSEGNIIDKVIVRKG